jgi:CheY-like chemotaxis protein
VPRRGGYVGDTAAHGRLALEQLQARAYDLIVCDLWRLELDGPGLYREREERYPEPRRRVIFLAGETLSPGAREFLDGLEELCLGKPFRAAEVRQALPVPSEVSLTHNEILCRDEPPDCKRHGLEGLGQPLG